MKTNIGLVQYVNSKLQLPTIYMLSGFGRVLTAAAVDKRIANGDAFTTANEAVTRSGIGKYCFDCCGLIKGYLWETAPGNVPYKIIEGVSYPNSDNGVQGMYNLSTFKGPIANMPDIPGMLVFTADLGHVGVYTGKKNGINQYVEATPAWKAWGVTTSADTAHPQGHNRKWTYYGKHYLINYKQWEDAKAKAEADAIAAKLAAEKAAAEALAAKLAQEKAAADALAAKLAAEKLAAEETARVAAAKAAAEAAITADIKLIKVGDTVSIIGSNYATGQIIPLWVKAKNYIVKEVLSDKALLSGINSWVYLKDLKEIFSAPIAPTTPVFVIKVGDRVKITGTKYAGGTYVPFWVKLRTYTVAQIKTDRVLLKEINSWVLIKDVIKV